MTTTPPVVAVAQLQCPTDDESARRIIALAAIAAAREAGAQIVVLPELAASGYRLERAYLYDVAEPGDGSGPMLTSWRAEARRRSIVVVGGFAERVGDALANAAVVIDAEGAVLARYRKLHLFGAEHDVFVPGDLGLPIVDVAGIRLGVLICYDLRFPEAVRILALRGAHAIAVPTAWVPGFDRAARSDGGIGQVDGVVVQANLNQVYIACADQIGGVGSTTFLGRSLVVDPFGAVTAGPLSADSPGIVAATVSASEVERARERGPGISPRANRRTDVYGELLGYVGPRSGDEGQ